jgi:hypothetical protein
MNGDDDEAEKTPPRTPSAQAKLGLVVCPKCEGTGLEHGADGITCDLCSGGRRVAVDVGIEYAQKHPK